MNYVKFGLSSIPKILMYFIAESYVYVNIHIVTFGSVDKR